MNYDDKLQWRTYRYIERYTNLEKKCQLCGRKAIIVCSDEYLKINLLCRNCRKRYKNLDKIPKIPVEAYLIKEPSHQAKRKRLKAIEEGLLKDIEGGYTTKELEEKYKLPSNTIYRFYKADEIKEKLRVNAKNKIRNTLNKHKENPMQKYRIEHQLSLKDFSNITGIPVTTIKSIENGKFNMGDKTKEKLAKAGIIII